MKAYIITIIGATLLSALAGIISPDKWRGYVRIITGLVIISCIISPVLKIADRDIFTGFNESFDAAAEGEDLQQRIVLDELKKRVNADIEARLKNEFNLSVKADCDIKVSDEGAIEGVREIRLSGDTLTDRAKNRLCEVYGITHSEVHNE